MFSTQEKADVHSCVWWTNTRMSTRLAYWEVTTVLSITARGDSVYFPLITDHKKVHESS